MGSAVSITKAVCKTLPEQLTPESFFKVTKGLYKYIDKVFMIGLI